MLVKARPVNHVTVLKSGRANIMIKHDSFNKNVNWMSTGCQPHTASYSTCTPLSQWVTRSKAQWQRSFGTTRKNSLKIIKGWRVFERKWKSVIYLRSMTSIFVQAVILRFLDFWTELEIGAELETSCHCRATEHIWAKKRKISHEFNKWSNLQIVNVALTTR